MFQSLKGIIGDFNHLGRIADTAEAKFQSLKGIIGDFNPSKLTTDLNVLLVFQSLKGIIGDFNLKISGTSNNAIGFNP